MKGSLTSRGEPLLKPDLLQPYRAQAAHRLVAAAANLSTKKPHLPAMAAAGAAAAWIGKWKRTCSSKSVADGRLADTNLIVSVERESATVTRWAIGATEGTLRHSYSVGRLNSATAANGDGWTSASVSGPSIAAASTCVTSLDGRALSLNLISAGGLNCVAAYRLLDDYTAYVTITELHHDSSSVIIQEGVMVKIAVES